MEQIADKEFEQIIKSAEKAIHYSQDDRETALLHARKSAEAICRDVYQKEINAIPERISLGQMIETLSRESSILPKKVMYSLRVIQNFGGVNAHENIDECLEPALEFFSIILTWYFEDYRKESIPTEIKFYRATSKPIFPLTGEQVVSLSNLEDFEDLTLVRANKDASLNGSNDGFSKIHIFTQDILVYLHQFEEREVIDVTYGRVFKVKPFLKMKQVDTRGHCGFEFIEQRVDGFKFQITSWGENNRPAILTEDGSEMRGVRKYKFTVSGQLT